MRKAIELDGYNLVRGSDRIKKSEWAIVAAAKQNVAVLRILPTDEEPLSKQLFLQIISKNPLAIVYLPESLKKDPEIAAKIRGIRQQLVDPEVSC